MESDGEPKLRPLLTEGKRRAGIRSSLLGEASVGGAPTPGASALMGSVGSSVTEGAELGIGASGGSWRPEELR